MIKQLRLFLFIGLAFWSCGEPANIEIKKAINLLDNDAYYFLDVRTAEEHKIKSIPDTDCISVQEIELRWLRKSCEIACKPLQLSQRVPNDSGQSQQK